jgi:peptidyl-prolyl cis-trans isomerase D
VIKNKRNSEVVEIAPGQLMAARIVDHKPAAMRPLDAVRGEIVKLLTDKEARELAQKAGADMLAELRAGKSVDVKWPAAKTVSREDPNGLDARTLAAVFRADTAKIPAYTGVGVGAKGYALFRISDVIDAHGLDDQKLAVSQFGLARQEATEDFQAFVAGLRERTKIEINPASLEKQPGG